MSKKCKVCGEQVDSGFVVCRPCADKLKNMVEVVMCKDCIFAEPVNYFANFHGKLTCTFLDFYHGPDDFCSYGERKQDEQKK